MSGQSAGADNISTRLRLFSSMSVENRCLSYDMPLVNMSLITAAAAATSYSLTDGLLAL
jgi:hypothetical protein